MRKTERAARARQTQKSSDPAAPTALEVIVQKNETNRQAVARKMTGPFTRHGIVTGEACSRLVGSFDSADKPGLTEYAWAIKERADKAATGDLEGSSALLMAQALSLDGIFTEYARIALVNVATNMDASERYMRLALRAQANSRATLEALAKLHQPREQTVRHVHVNEGGQAIVADQFHHHPGGQGNGRLADQSHAQCASVAALPSPDAEGHALPVSGTRRPETLPASRRESGSAEGQP